MTSPKVQRYPSLLATIATDEHGLIWAKVYRDSTVARAADGAKKATQKGAKLALSAPSLLMMVFEDGSGSLRSERLMRNPAGGFTVLDETQLDLPL